MEGYTKIELNAFPCPKRAQVKSDVPVLGQRGVKRPKAVVPGECLNPGFSKRSKVSIKSRRWGKAIARKQCPKVKAGRIRDISRCRAWDTVSGSEGGLGGLERPVGPRHMWGWEGKVLGGTSSHHLLFLTAFHHAVCYIVLWFPFQVPSLLPLF